MQHAGKTPRIVVTGRNGLLGRHLIGLRGAVAGFTRAELDITSEASVSAVLRPGDVVINCAAYAAVDDAESDPDTAYAVNAAGPGVLADVSARVGARLIHVSTDYVFDGHASTPYEVTSATAPVNVYGQSKLEGEERVLGSGAQAHVVRTALLYDGAGNDFVGTMRRLAAERDAIDVVDDQIGSPTYVGDFAAALLELAARHDAPALLHATNTGHASRYELARAVFGEIGADPDRVRPVPTTSFPRPAQRPAYTALSGASWIDAGLTPLRPWRAGLSEALAAVRAGRAV